MVRFFDVKFKNINDELLNPIILMKKRKQSKVLIRYRDSGKTIKLNYSIELLQMNEDKIIRFLLKDYLDNLDTV